MGNSNNFFIDKEQIRTIDYRRIVYFISFLVSFFLTEIGRKIYRPFIYENDINDFGLADSVGNSGGIIVQIFFGLTILNSSYKKGFRLIGLFVIGYILYEVVQPYLPRGVFDLKDVYGTLLGGFVGLLIYLLIHALLKRNKVLYKF